MSSITDADPTTAPAEQPEAPAENPQQDTRDRLAIAFEGLGSILAPMVAQFTGQTGPVVPVAGRIECQGCQESMRVLRSDILALSTHLEQIHEWWPAELDSVLLDLHKTTSRLSRGLRNVRHVELAIGAAPVDPYAASPEREVVGGSLQVVGDQYRNDDAAPDTTGTPVSSPERLSAVLQRRGQGPLYDANLDPGDGQQEIAPVELIAHPPTPDPSLERDPSLEEPPLNDNPQAEQPVAEPVP